MQLRVNFNQLSTGFLVPLLLLVLLAGGFVIVRPKYKEVKAKKTALADKANLVSTKEKQLSSIKELIADLDKKHSDLDLVDEALPDAPAIPEILSGLEIEALQSGLVISTLVITLPSKAPGPVPATGTEAVPSSKILSMSNLAVMELNLNLKGKYINLKSFLKNLEQNRRIMDVSALNFSTAEEDGSQTYTVKIRTYYQKE